MPSAGIKHFWFGQSKLIVHRREKKTKRDAEMSMSRRYFLKIVVDGSMCVHYRHVSLLHIATWIHRRFQSRHKHFEKVTLFYTKGNKSYTLHSLNKHYINQCRSPGGL